MDASEPKTVETKTNTKPSGKPIVDSGVKQKSTSDSTTKNLNQLLDVVKKEKRQKTHSFPSKGHVLKATQPEPMEVDVVNRDNIKQDEVEQTVVAEESEDTLEDFIFVRNYVQKAVVTII